VCEQGDEMDAKDNAKNESCEETTLVADSVSGARLVCPKSYLEATLLQTSIEFSHHTRYYTPACHECGYKTGSPTKQ
jgi:hypothetical protein